VASSAAVTGIISYLVKRYLDKYFKKKDAQEEETQKKLKEAEALKEEKQREERKNDLVDVVQNQLVPVINKIDDLAVKVGKTEDGALAGLRNDILTSYYRCSETGYRGERNTRN
jgi:seryl-tRNA synthetase